MWLCSFLFAQCYSPATAFLCLPFLYSNHGVYLPSLGDMRLCCLLTARNRNILNMRDSCLKIQIFCRHLVFEFNREPAHQCLFFRVPTGRSKSLQPTPGNLPDGKKEEKERVFSCSNSWVLKHDCCLFMVIVVCFGFVVLLLKPSTSDEQQNLPTVWACSQHWRGAGLVNQDGTGWDVLRYHH
jgi:hypothetical protein